MLDVIQVTKQYKKGSQLFTAVQEVSLSIQRDEVFALVGESGSGKSTLAEMIIGLQRPTKGSIVCEASPRQVQMVFQNPDRSMNPYWKVKDIISEPLVLSKVPRDKASHLAAKLLERVKLPSAVLERRPSECSGGQKQRIAIARALTLSPALLIADEITSALDPFTEEEILSLLLELKREQRMSILYITHRLETIGGFADTMAVMKSGTVVESGAAEQILRHPQSDYTKALLAAYSYEV